MQSINFPVVILISIIVMATVIAFQSVKVQPKKSTINASPKATSSPTASPTQNPSPKTSPRDNNLLFESSEGKSSPRPNNDSGFIYPNSKQISVGKEIVLESNDDPKVITEWYKEKIRQEKMNAKSFVQTNTNGKVLNKLVGSNGQREISVEITKENDKSEVTIKLKIS